jgi:two-component system, cell cycle sensor histidine kinase and response regulator CckA
VLLACEGAEAVALYAQRQQDIALVLTDMAMPTMDGVALIGALRAMNPRVRIIGCSGFSSDGGADGAASLGIGCFVPKPYTAEVMLNALHDLLGEAVSPVPE